MTHICREKNALRHDDKVDVLAMLVAFFIEIMDQDAAKSENDEQSEELRRELEHIHDLHLEVQFDAPNNLCNSTA